MSMKTEERKDKMLKCIVKFCPLLLLYDQKFELKANLVRCLNLYYILVCVKWSYKVSDESHCIVAILQQG